jgi:hypothetical protein
LTVVAADCVGGINFTNVPPVTFDLDPPEAPPTYGGSVIDHGQWAIFERLPPRTYTVVAHTPGGDLPHATVRVEAGTATVVDLNVGVWLYR